MPRIKREQVLLYSYVVDHDTGYAPNPYDGLCTLVQCKYARGKRRNIVELADEGDWIIGTGGKGRRSTGPGKIVYLMQVNEKISLSEYAKSHLYSHRSDVNDLRKKNDRFALISRKYFYFGKNAIPIDRLPEGLRQRPLEKKGPGYRRDFSEDFIAGLTRWFEVGVHGRSCCDGKSDLGIRLQCNKR